MHRHTPQSKGEEEAKSTTSGDSTQTLQLRLSNDKYIYIKKQRISQPFISKKNIGQERTYGKRKRTVNVSQWS